MQSDNWVAKKPPQKPSSEMVPVQFTESGQDATNMLGHDEQKCQDKAFSQNAGTESGPDTKFQQ